MHLMTDAIVKLNHDLPVCISIALAATDSADGDDLISNTSSSEVAQHEEFCHTSGSNISWL